MPLDIVSPSDVSAVELNALLRNTDKPVLAYVWAPFCPPCKTMSPEIEKTALLLKDQTTIVRLNAVSAPQSLTGFNIAAVPSLILFSKDGREIARTLGALTARQVTDWVTKSDMSQH